MGEQFERRAYPRLPTNIKARFLINGETAGEGCVTDLSAGGMGIKTPVKAGVADHVVLHLAGGMRFDGRVVRITREGFSLVLDVSDARRRSLKRKLDSFFGAEDPPEELAIERRLSPRIAGPEEYSICLTDTDELKCRIIDMSLVGVAMKVDGELKLGDKVTIGKTAGRVVRCDGDIYGVEFDTPWRPHQFHAPETTQERMRPRIDAAAAEKKPIARKRA